MAENKQSVETPEKIVESSVEERRAKWEREKMTRRQSLSRFGFLAGATAVAALTADDLTRLVGKELQKRAESGKVVEQVAKELQNAGIAFSTTDPSGCMTQDCLTACDNTGQRGYCMSCCSCAKCLCIYNIPQEIKFPVGWGIDCTAPVNRTATICQGYNRRLTDCDNAANKCVGDCMKIPPPPTPTPAPTPTPKPTPTPAPTPPPPTPTPTSTPLPTPIPTSN